MTIVIATSKHWNESLCDTLRKRLSLDVHLIAKKEELNFSYLKKIKPKFVFFPHWSYLIPEEVFENFHCVIFHMTDLPYGRGGSPLQNLIIRGHKETKITALKCVKELDAGPIYLKSKLSLEGSAREIFERAKGIIEDMIIEIIDSKKEPISQFGEPVCFKRRTPADSNLATADELEKIYDMIRMLDADSYPHSYLDFGKFRVEFTNAQETEDGVVAHAYFKKNKE